MPSGRQVDAKGGYKRAPSCVIYCSRGRSGVTIDHNAHGRSIIPFAPVILPSDVDKNRRKNHEALRDCSEK
jgi:hypothetical protein